MSEYQPGIYIVRNRYGSHLEQYAPKVTPNTPWLQFWEARASWPDGDIVSDALTPDQILATMTAHLCDSCRELVRMNMQRETR